MARSTAIPASGPSGTDNESSTRANLGRLLGAADRPRKGSADVGRGRARGGDRVVGAVGAGAGGARASASIAAHLAAPTRADDGAGQRSASAFRRRSGR